jgi:hypothetical protein
LILGGKLRHRGRVCLCNLVRRHRDYLFHIHRIPLLVPTKQCHRYRTHASRVKCFCYTSLMATKALSPGVLHPIPADLRKALLASTQAHAAWEDITPLARNEWICWTMSVKTPTKRREHVERVVSELKEGMRRPCCWIGCTHRTDKKLSRSQKWVLGKKKKT